MTTCGIGTLTEGWWQEMVDYEAADFFMAYAEKAWNLKFTGCSVRRCRELEEMADK